MDFPAFDRNLSFPFICERIYNCWQLQTFCYTPDHSLEYSSLAGFFPSDSSFLSPEFLNNFYTSCRNHELPVILNEEDNICFCGFLDHEQKLYLLGPFTSHFVSFADNHRYAHSHNIAQKDFLIPTLALDKLLSAVSLICLLLTGRHYTEQEIMENNNSGIIDLPKELTMYQLDNYLQEKERQPYEEELLWMNQIKTGDSGESSAENSNYTRGIMAKTPFKQEEYLALSGITLATRVMIQEGVPATEAYNLSDIYCQKLSECKTILDIYNVYKDAEAHIKQLIQVYKSQSSNNQYVEKCKNYIGSHLHSKLTIPMIAKTLGISASWLSRSFSQAEKMSVSSYIMKQKLAASKNMLKYSPASVGEIAEWLCFNSQSHFGECFKKEYGITPKEFRNSAGGF